MANDIGVDKSDTFFGSLISFVISTLAYFTFSLTTIVLAERPDTSCDNTEVNQGISLLLSL